MFPAVLLPQLLRELLPLLQLHQLPYERRETQIAAAVASMEGSARFDVARLADLTEEIRFQASAQQASRGRGRGKTSYQQ